MSLGMNLLSSLLVKPGAMALTRMLYLPSSTAMQWVKWQTAAFALE